MGMKIPRAACDDASINRHDSPAGCRRHEELVTIARNKRRMGK
jgi:hypothetical protein